MSLQDLVTGALPEREGDDLSPRDILQWQNRHLAPPPLEMAEMAEEIAGGQWEKAKIFIAWMTLLSRGIMPMRYAPAAWPRASAELLEFVFLVEEATNGNPDSAEAASKQFREYAEDIRAGEARRRRQETLDGIVNILDYIQESFGEETESVLQELCGVGQQTVRGWMRGVCPRNASIHKIRTLAGEVYTLRERGVEGTEIVAWLRTPLPSGKTPLEVWEPRMRFRPSIAPKGLLEGLGNLGQTDKDFL